MCLHAHRIVALSTFTDTVVVCLLHTHSVWCNCLYQDGWQRSLIIEICSRRMDVARKKEIIFFSIMSICLLGAWSRCWCSFSLWQHVPVRQFAWLLFVIVSASAITSSHHRHLRLKWTRANIYLQIISFLRGAGSNILSTCNWTNREMLEQIVNNDVCTMRIHLFSVTSSHSKYFVKHIKNTKNYDCKLQNNSVYYRMRLFLCAKPWPLSNCSLFASLSL